jgi:hypothetical protein
VPQPARAVEYGIGEYLLGFTIPMSGYTPPPGVYFSDTFYLYQGVGQFRLGVTCNGNMGTIMRWAFVGFSAILVWPQVATAHELPDCKTIRNAGKKMECLQNSIAILQKQATGNVVQMGSKAFGQDQSDSPSWSLQDLPRGGPTSWTSPPISFAQQFATKPAVSVAIAGIANLDVDRFGFSAEATDIKVTMRH